MRINFRGWFWFWVLFVFLFCFAGCLFFCYCFLHGFCERSEVSVEGEVWRPDAEPWEALNEAEYRAYVNVRPAYKSPEDVIDALSGMGWRLAPAYRGEGETGAEIMADPPEWPVPDVPEGDDRWESGLERLVSAAQAVLDYWRLRVAGDFVPTLRDLHKAVEALPRDPAPSPVLEEPGLQTWHVEAYDGVEELVEATTPEEAAEKWYLGLGAGAEELDWCEEAVTVTPVASRYRCHLKMVVREAKFDVREAT